MSHMQTCFLMFGFKEMLLYSVEKSNLRRLFSLWLEDTLRPRSSLWRGKILLLNGLMLIGVNFSIFDDSYNCGDLVWLFASSVSIAI